MITRALGPDAEALCDGYICPLSAGEYVLLCTDGLSNLLDDQEILFEVAHGTNYEDCGERLMQIVLGRGAPDNVTMILVYDDK